MTWKMMQWLCVGPWRFCCITWLPVTFVFSLSNHIFLKGRLPFGSLFLKENQFFFDLHIPVGSLCGNTKPGHVFVFPQVNAPLSAPGPSVVRSSPAQMNWHVTIAHTRARSASTVQCVTSASWGATTWLNMPGDMQASIPACSKAQVLQRGAGAPCLSPVILVTRALLGCESHPVLLFNVV